jgi:hypothetical protein
MLRPTVSRSGYLGIMHPFGAYNQIFVIVSQLRVYWCGALSLTRGRVCRLQWLLATASALVLGSESRGTRDHILVSQIRDFPFRRLLQLAGLRWRYSTPPPHGMQYFGPSNQLPSIIATLTEYKSPCERVNCLLSFCWLSRESCLSNFLSGNNSFVAIRCSGNVVS